jgi:Zn-dependent M28 family amino/carboxypeptidase
MCAHRLLAAVAAISLSAVGIAQTNSGSNPEFMAERFRSHVAFLADDLLEGRNTGERGHEIAARYVATQLAGLGVEPAVNGDWYQRVPFVEFELTDAPAKLTIGGTSFDNRSDVIVSASPFTDRTSIEAPVVFAGYGLDVPALGLNDYAGLDVKGKIVAILPGTPKGLASDIAAHLGGSAFPEKRRMAQARGAAGIVSLIPPAAAKGFAAAAANPGRPGITWVETSGRPFSPAPALAFAATLGKPASDLLFAGAPKTVTDLFAEAAAGGRPKGFALAPTMKIERQGRTKSFTSPNVIGMIPGSDPKLANEYVLLMAHLDHIGISPNAPGDQINNGALDNATGISTLLEVARAMTQGGKRPRRPILFAAVTGEEKGLLGAQYLAKNPVVGNGKVVGVVNLDMPVLLYDFVDVIAFGAEHSTLGPIVDRAGARMNVKRIEDPLPEQGLFTRSDHYRFVQEGIPSVFLMTGFGNGGDKQFTNFLATNYHKPSDDLSQPINWEAGAKFARINYLIAREIADADQAPRWYEGSFFGDTYAPGQPKARRTAK